RTRTTLNELLNPLTIRIGGIDRALRVDDDSVDPVELARPPALFAPDRENLSVLQRELQDAFVLVIGNPANPVGALARDVHVPRIPVVADLADVIQVPVEHFDAVSLAIDDVEILVGVHRKLVRQVPFARSGALVFRTARTFADLLDELPVLVEHDDAIVAVAVGDDDVAVVQDGDPRRQVEVRGVVAFDVGRAELHQELVELRRQLDDTMRVALDDVDVAFPIDAA